MLTERETTEEPPPAMVPATEIRDELMQVDAHTRNRRLRKIALSAIVLALVGFVMWLGSDVEVTPWWVSAVYPVFFCAASVRCFRVSRLLAADERRAWLYFGVGCMGYAISEAIWGIYDSFLGNPLPSPSVADIGYMLTPILFGVGIWHWRARTPTAWVSRVQLGNLGIIVSSVLLTYLFMFYGFVQAPVSTSTAIIGITYGILNVSVAIFALVVVHLHLWSRKRTVSMLILFALIANAGSDVYYSYSLMTTGYDPSNVMNFIYLLTALNFFLAAVEQDELCRHPRDDKPTYAVEERAKQWETLLPPLAVISVLVVAFVFRDGMHRDMLPYVAAALIVFTVSLGMRNWFGHRMEMQLRMNALASETRLEESNRELRREMQARSRVEEELRQSQKMEALGQLTGGVAHDFNNLLAVILGNLEMAEHAGGTNSLDRAWLREATDAANRGAALTQRLLTLSRKQSLKPEPIEVSALLDDTRELLARSLGEQISLEIGDAQPGLHCLADRSQLEGAILNLAINARDAMPQGGKLSFEVSQVARDAIDTRETDALVADFYMLIRVKDTGVGIPDHLLDRVFEPFFTTKGVGEGTGLGLSMVYGFAKQSGGHVEIGNVDDGGTEIRLYLPRSESEPTTRERETPSDRRCSRGESVLVVEDESALRRLITGYLGNLGYSVIAAADGEEAVSTIESHESIDLLLSDVVLPGALSGTDVAREMRARWPDVKVLLMSGYTRESIQKGRPAAACEYLLNKPFQLNDLAEELRAILDS